jgi:hypothetical protein
MAKPGRNDPCPCGSTLKYKKCCLTKREAARLAVAPPSPPARRVIVHRGRPLLTSGRGCDLPPGLLDHVVDTFEARDRGEGPAAQMMRFVQPLLDAAGDDEARQERALSLGVAFWNLALCDDARHETMLAEMAGTIDEFGQDEGEFSALAATMVARHRAMFPALHR